MCKYGVISGPYFPGFGLTTSYLSVFSPNTGKYGPEITLYLDTSHSARDLGLEILRLQIRSGRQISVLRELISFYSS